MRSILPDETYRIWAKATADKLPDELAKYNKILCINMSENMSIQPAKLSNTDIYYTNIYYIQLNELLMIFRAYLKFFNLFKCFQKNVTKIQSAISKL